MLRSLIAALILGILVGSILLLQNSDPSASLRESSRRLQAVLAEPELDAEAKALKLLRESLCAEETPRYPPLPYDSCPENEVLNVIPLMGGMTNALKMVLLGAIMSFEEGRCFYVDESTAHLNPEKDGKRDGFIQKYFEPIGLPKDHPYVVKAFAEGRIKRRKWTEYWNDLDRRRVEGTNFTLPTLGYENIEGHQLKKHFLRRMWKPLPRFRESTCKSLTELDLGDEFLGFSVRRGDKTLENFAYTPLIKYIQYAETQLHRFGGKIPKIFVASDDCTVMAEFRRMKPDWTFVSECDKEDKLDSGFALREVKQWGNEKEIAHFSKFFVEMYALAVAKVVLGVSYTNVSWWVYFMRPFKHSFYLLDKKEGRADQHILRMW